VRPLISLAYPVPNQVPCLVRAALPQLVPATWLMLRQVTAAPVVEGRLGCQAERSQQKVSNPLTRDVTRTSAAAIHEHVTAPVDTGRHALRAFGTKRPGVRTRHLDRWYGECGCPVLASVSLAWLAYGGLDGWDTP
jgi:hypothetical protein